MNSHPDSKAHSRRLHPLKSKKNGPPRKAAPTKAREPQDPPSKNEDGGTRQNLSQKLLLVCGGLPSGAAVIGFKTLAVWNVPDGGVQRVSRMNAAQIVWDWRIQQLPVLSAVGGEEQCSDLPITQQTLSEVAEPAVKSVVTPLCCGCQVLPRSVLRSILPASPRRQACFSPGATMRRRSVVACCTRSAVYPALTGATCAEATFCASCRGYFDALGHTLRLFLLFFIGRRVRSGADRSRSGVQVVAQLTPWSGSSPHKWK